jgi:predicted MFS family arabinose efflux permease
MPVYVRELLQGGASLFGVLTAVTACGAVAAGVLLSRIGSAVDDLTAYVLGVGVVGVTVAVVGLVHVTPVVLLASLLAGFGFTAVAVFGTNLIQQWAGEEYVGRVIGLYRTGTKGGQAVGMILAGVAATAFGTPATLLIATILVLSTAATLLPAVGRSRSEETGSSA